MEKLLKLNMPFILGAYLHLANVIWKAPQYGARLWGGDAKYSPTELVLHSPR